MWDIQEAVAYYRRHGAPGDQTALIELLREAQKAHGDGIPEAVVEQLAELLEVKASLLLALVRRIPSLRLSQGHTLELCAGPNCSKRAALAAFVEKTYGKDPAGVSVKYVPCMRMCGKGPNIRWDGRIHHQADEQLIRTLMAQANARPGEKQ